MTEAEAKVLADAGLITPEQATALVATGSTTANTSPPVWMGKKVVTSGFREAPGLKVEETIVPADKAASMFYSWSEKELRDFQEKAYNAGMYGRVDRNRIPWGDHDEDTLSIWKTMVARSAGFYENGEKVTPWDAMNRAAEKAPMFEEDTGRTVSVSNPEDLIAVLRAGARQHLGSGNLDPAQQQRLVAAFQSAQRGAQAEGSEVGAPSASVFFENRLRELEPEKYDARKVIGGLRAAHEFLGGARG